MTHIPSLTTNLPPPPSPLCSLSRLLPHLSHRPRPHLGRAVFARLLPLMKRRRGAKLPPRRARLQNRLTRAQPRQARGPYRRPWRRAARRADRGGGARGHDAGADQPASRAQCAGRGDGYAAGACQVNAWWLMVRAGRTAGAGEYVESLQVEMNSGSKRILTDFQFQVTRCCSPLDLKLDLFKSWSCRHDHDEGRKKPPRRYRAVATGWVLLPSLARIKVTST